MAGPHSATRSSMVVVIAADAGTLRCRLSAQPHYGVFVLAFAPWPAAHSC